MLLMKLISQEVGTQDEDKTIDKRTITILKPFEQSRTIMVVDKQKVRKAMQPNLPRIQYTNPLATAVRDTK